MLCLRCMSGSVVLRHVYIWDPTQNLNAAQHFSDDGDELKSKQDLPSDDIYSQDVISSKGKTRHHSVVAPKTNKDQETANSGSITNELSTIREQSTIRDQSTIKEHSTINDTSLTEDCVLKCHTTRNQTSSLREKNTAKYQTQIQEYKTLPNFAHEHKLKEPRTDIDSAEEIPTNSEFLRNNCAKKFLDPDTRETSNRLSQHHIDKSWIVHNLDITSQTDDITAKSDDITSQSDDIRAESDDITAQSDDITSQTDDITAHSDDKTSHSDDITTKSDDIIQHANDDLRSITDTDRSSSTVHQVYLAHSSWVV
ncbi:unnamed protein product [Owenia fusiformis]|uniref:Uncharacterized protein n=1 Tax=Owenia fusiformis TaxID=6347 RepID=A0A8S4NLR9_OWEFU|nr:unnamed protein product [Owenia fusiformis]